MNYEDETIVANASGMVESGIIVIRISGDKALSIANDIAVPFNKNVDIMGLNTYTAKLVRICDNDKILDEAILLYMKGPHSYTGEDVVELSVHGGVYVANKVIELIIRKGARIAEPGEFTKRAFLNGRIDLTQAEAVMDVIRADYDKSLDMSVRQLNGELRDKIIEIRDVLIHENAYIEHALDDPEHVSLEGFSDRFYSILENVEKEIRELTESYYEGRIINDGINTAIVGSPNAGKSSLLNILLNEERAIVTDIAGTTRDTIRERVIYKEIPINIVDTAGIRETSDVVEKIGVSKAKEEIENAELILYVIDGSMDDETFEAEESRIIELLENKKVIVVLNKSDLGENITEERIKEHVNAEVIRVSMTEKTGFEKFDEVLKNMFFSGNIGKNNNIVITNRRQKECLDKALDSVKKVMEGIELGVSEDFYTIDLLDAYSYLGEVIGESYEDDLANRIFADFCVGK